MNAVVTIDVTLDLDGPFAGNGRARRDAVARSLRRLFASPAWRGGDEALERVFGASEIEHRYRDRASGARVRVRETQGSGVAGRGAPAVVRPAAQDGPGAPELEAMAAEALLYLEAVSLACADGGTEIRGGRRCLDARRFRETAGWTGRPRRVRGVFRPETWEAMIESFAAELGAEAAERAREAVRENHAVWPLSLEFTSEFFPVAAKLFRLVTAELAARNAAESANEAGMRRVLPFPAPASSETIAACSARP